MAALLVYRVELPGGGSIRRRELYGSRAEAEARLRELKAQGEKIKGHRIGTQRVLPK